MSIRSPYLFGFIVVCALLSTSIYFQIFDGIMPCPLCTLQRITFGILGILFFIGMLARHRHKLKLVITALCWLFSIIGVLFAGRQVWLQNFPSADGGECGVSIQYMLQVLPINEVFQKVFSGSAECTQRGWEFLHLNMAEWALICFVGFFIMTLCMFIEELKWKSKK
jgi:disulfide bond formation protein DsbB